MPDPVSRPPVADERGEMMDRFCLRCHHPYSRHVPGPPDPPRIKGHLGETRDSRPGICNQLDRMVEVSAEVRQELKLLRAQRDERNAEASRYLAALDTCQQAIGRAKDEGNYG